MRRLFPAFAVVALFAMTGLVAHSQDKDKKPVEKPAQKTPEERLAALPKRTVAALHYGLHERQVLDFWQAKSDKPTPLVLMIHGGGWQAGDKSGIGAGQLKQWLDAGISVAAINYRYTKQAAAYGVSPPVKAPLEDAARALQTIRSKATEWNLDKVRVGATGGSAGACSSLWLAFHDDMANSTSTDPVARESTRLFCAAVDGAQVSLDPKELREWIPNYGYGSHAFGLKNFAELQEKREDVLKWIKEYSPIEHLTKDDPPIFLSYGKQETPPVVGTAQKDATHSGIMGIKLQERCKAVGVECLLLDANNPDPNVHYKGTTDYLIDRLKK